MLNKYLSSALIIFAFAGALPLAAAFADIYKYVDESGVIHLTNVPHSANANYVLVYREKRILFNIKAKDVVKFDQIISKASEKYNVDAALIKAIIKTESNFNHKAVSPKGAQGLMQLMPRTAHALQVEDSFHPENNIEGGTRYLRYLLNLFDNNLPLALAAYNAGENAVIRYNKIPPYRETQTYVQRVLSHLNTYSRD
jgi:soluble lytic murein transglycosylase-like protein